MALPIVYPHAPASLTATARSMLAIDPATITGPLDAWTTARISSRVSAVGWRYASRSRPATWSSPVSRSASAAISSIVAEQDAGVVDDLAGERAVLHALG